MTQPSPSLIGTRPEDDEQQSAVTQPSGGFAGPVQSAQRPPEFNRPEPEESEEEETPAGGGAEGVAGLEGMDPEFARRLGSLIKQTGGAVYVTSGYRSEQEQARLYQNALAKYGSPQAAGKWVAPPGKSNHGKGTAADLGGNLALAKQLAPSLGLHFPMGHEPWHIEPVGVRTDPATPREAYTDPATKDNPVTPAEARALIADTILSDASTRLTNPGQSFAGPVQTAERPPEFNIPEEEAAGAEATAGGDIDSWIAQAIRITGVGEDWAAPLKVIAQRESGFNPKAQNNWDSNAKKGIPSKGLMQTIDPTFQSHKMEGYDDIWNPVHNLIAAIRYIQARYKGNVAGIAGRGGGY